MAIHCIKDANLQIDIELQKSRLSDVSPSEALLLVLFWKAAAGKEGRILAYILYTQWELNLRSAMKTEAGRGLSDSHT